MKRNFLLMIIFLAVLLPASAQDTVTYSDNIYFIKDKNARLITFPWDKNLYLDTTSFDVPFFIPYNIYPHIHQAIADFNVSDAITVYGIAITIDPDPGRPAGFTTGSLLWDTYDFKKDTARYLQVKLMTTQNWDDPNIIYTVEDSMSFDTHGQPPLLKKASSSIRLILLCIFQIVQFLTSVYHNMSQAHTQLPQVVNFILTNHT